MLTNEANLLAQANISTLKRGDIVTVYRLSGLLGGNDPFYSKFDAKVMAVADGYAMLRRPGCIPFVESVKTLEKWKTNPPKEQP